MHNTFFLTVSLLQAQDSSGSVSTAILQVVMRTQDTSIPHPQHFTTPGPPCRPASSTACPCLATRSRGRPRLSFTRLSYAAEVFSTDTFVGRVEASVGGRGGRVRYSWGEHGRGETLTGGTFSFLRLILLQISTQFSCSSLFDSCLSLVCCFFPFISIMFIGAEQQIFSYIDFVISMFKVIISFFCCLFYV